MNLTQMIPYGELKYFLYLAIVLAPIVISLYFWQRRLPIYQTLATLFFLYISFSGPYGHQGLALIGYVLWQLLLVTLYFKYRQEKNDRWIFYGAVFLALIPLIGVKLIPFFNLGKPTLLYFLGISYLTFKSVQMIMEIRDGVIKEFHPWRYLQFLLFFPTISSGPIDRYRRFEEDLLTAPSKDKYLGFLDRGVWYIFLGFFYKFVMGYLLGSLLLPYLEGQLLSDGIFSRYSLGYMYVYSLYLFFDFAGYSLFAVGTSLFLGYDTPINFNKPFIAHNIKDFWNRWHMSLSFWFRDYVYMRLMYAFMKNKTFKSRITTSNVGYLCLFTIMGVWHGLTWYYVLYGFIHAGYICLNDAWLRYKKKHGKTWPKNKFTEAVAIFITFNAVCLSLLVFSGVLDKLFFK